MSPAGVGVGGGVRKKKEVMYGGLSNVERGVDGGDERHP